MQALEEYTTFVLNDMHALEAVVWRPWKSTTPL